MTPTRKKNRKIKVKVKPDRDHAEGWWKTRRKMFRHHIAVTVISLVNQQSPHRLSRARWVTAHLKPDPLDPNLDRFPELASSNFFELLSFYEMETWAVRSGEWLTSDSCGRVTPRTCVFSNIIVCFGLSTCVEKMVLEKARSRDPKRATFSKGKKVQISTVVRRGAISSWTLFVWPHTLEQKKRKDTPSWWVRKRIKLWRCKIKFIGFSTGEDLLEGPSWLEHGEKVVLSCFEFLFMVSWTILFMMISSFIMIFF